MPLTSSVGQRRAAAVAAVVVLAALCVLALAAGAPPRSAAAPFAATQRDGWLSGQVVVRYVRGTSARARAAVRRRAHARLGRTMKLGDHELLLVGRGRTAAAVRRLNADPRVVVAEPNYLLEPASCPITPTSGVCRPDDPAFPSLFHLRNTGQQVGNTAGVAGADIDATEAWDMTTGSSKVTLAIVDTGLTFDQPDLAPQIWNNEGEKGTDSSGRDKRSNGVDDDRNGYVDDWRGWDVVGRSITGPADSDNDPTDLRGHGTHVAGIAGAVGNNGYGGTGVNWNVKLMAVRAQGSRSQMTMADVAEAFAYAADNGARIVNASIASDERSSILDRVVADRPNTLFVIAANNRQKDLDQPGNDAYPCEATDPNDPSKRAPNVICVAATDNRDRFASWFSNYGAKSVDLGAPGNNVNSLQPVYQTIWSEGFETDPFAGGRWVTGAASGSTSRWARAAELPRAGTYSLADSPGGPYTGPGNTWVQTGSPISLAGRQGCRLTVGMNLATAGSDGLYVQARRDTAFGAPRPDYDDDRPSAFGDMMQYFKGSFVGGKRLDVSDFDGGPLNVRMGLLARAANTTGANGVNLDALSVQCLGGTYPATGTGPMETETGTSMASPVVAGVAALVLARFPQATTQEIKDKILRSVDPLPSLAGKTVTGGRVNAYKALAETTAAVRNGVLDVAAGDGERNNLVVTPINGGFRVTDDYSTGAGTQTGSRLMPGAGCTRLSETSVSCAATSYVLDADDLDGATEDTVPNTTITSGPSGATSSTSASFAFSADESGVTFTCRLDGGAWTPCASPTSYSGLTGGAHTFDVRGTGSGGDTELTPATRSWTVPGTPVDTAPAAPSGLVASGGDARVTLDWQDNGESDLAGYDIFRSTTAGGPYSKINGARLATSAYTDTTVANGTTYRYVVRAVDDAGQVSGNSNEASATPDSGSSGPPPTGSAYRDAVVSTPGLISYWRLGEGPGASTAADETGARPGTYFGGLALGQPGALAGDANTSAAFDGVDDRMEVPDSAALRPSSITVEVWARSDTPNWTGSGWMASKRNAIVLYPTAGARTVTWRVQKTNGTAVSVSYVPPSITGWHHYVATYDAAGGVAALYVDGVRRLQKTIVAGGLLGSPTPLTFGSDQLSLRRWGRGGLDEPAIYDRALPAATIEQHYAAGTGAG